jgi:hypothetical protein
LLGEQKWQTPTASEESGSGLNGCGKPKLKAQAKMWATPSAAVMNDGESPATWHARAEKLKAKHTNGNGAGLPLTIAAMQWPTPAAQDFRSEQGGVDFVNKRMTEARGQTLSFMAAHSLLPALSPPNGPQSSIDTPSLPRRLNPLFGENLMGWPSQWTKAEPSASSASATVLWRSALRSHLSNLLNDQD